MPASMVQGSSIDPSSFSIAESNIKFKCKLFEVIIMDKFADDIDLITTLEYHDQIDDEIDNRANWADDNLLLNKIKTKEIILTKS